MNKDASLQIIAALEKPRLTTLRKTRKHFEYVRLVSLMDGGMR